MLDFLVSALVGAVIGAMLGIGVAQLAVWVLEALDK